MPNDQSWSTVAASPAERVVQDITLFANYRDLPAPTIAAVAASATSITISLTAPSDNGATYRLQRSPDGVNFTDVQGEILASEFDLDDLDRTAEATYYYRLRAENAYGASAYSAVVSATTLAGEVVSPPAEGGIEGLTYSAPNGLVDTQTLVVDVDEAVAGFNFGAGPTSVATLGFGQGELYTKAIGEYGAAHTDPLSGEAWTFEHATGREIADAGNDARSYKTAAPGEDGTAGGYISYILPDLLPENEKVFISSLSKGVTTFASPPAPSDWYQVTSLSATEIGLDRPFDSYNQSGDEPFVISASKTDGAQSYRLRASATTGGQNLTVTEGDPLAAGFAAGDFIGLPTASQWKGLRVSDTGGYGSNSPSTNFYTTFANGTRSYSQDGGRLVYLDLSGGPGDQLHGGWVRFDLEAMLGNYDTPNGWIRGNQLGPSEGHPAIYGDYYGEASKAVTLHSATAGQMRWGAFSWQGYCKGMYNPELWRTDFVVQCGSLARFELANSDSPATTTEAYFLPPILVQWTENRVELHLWKALFTDYTGLHVHFYDDSGTFKGSFPL